MDDWDRDDAPAYDGGMNWLGGGPKLPGVDYAGAWLEARQAVSALNAALGRLGLVGDEVVRAQAGWADDGSGVVCLRGTAAGARRLATLLERFADSNDRGDSA
ncbi:hypothetical protein QBC98_004728 [Kitasatospora acidiphila]